MIEYYIGVMSGTSLDGVDVVYCSIENSKIQELSALEFPFDAELKTLILEAISGTTTLSEIGKIDYQLGELFAKAINALIKQGNLDPSKITAIGLHGQTLWHEPNSATAFSMQLGNASVVHAQTGICVIYDFRSLDIAYGGQGAPLVPAFHQEIFGHLSQRTVVLNLGGIANVSFLGSNIRGFDTGPANVLLDYWCEKHLQKPFDKNGEWAHSGKCDNGLLTRLLEAPYFQKSTPKSTGREEFNAEFLENHLSAFPNISAPDVQATLLELTTQSISDALKFEEIELLILCGGGAKNSALVSSLQVKLPQTKLESSEVYGVNSDNMEALAFAWLAYKRVHQEVVPLSSVTGASKDLILGAIIGAV